MQHRLDAAAPPSRAIFQPSLRATGNIWVPRSAGILLSGAVTVLALAAPARGDDLTLPPLNGDLRAEPMDAAADAGPVDGEPLGPPPRLGDGALDPAAGGTLLAPAAHGLHNERGFPLTPRLRILPFVRLSAYYDTNPLRAPEDADPEGGAALLLSAGLDLVALRERTELRLGYGASFTRYPDFEQLDQNEHRGRFLAAYSGTRLDATLRAGVGVLGRSDDPRAVGDPMRRLLTDAAFRIDWRARRTAELGIEGDLRYLNFLSGGRDAGDRISYGAAIRAGATFGLPVLLEVGGRIRQIRYVDDEAATSPDLVTFGPFAGLRAELADDLAAEVRLGYEIGRVTEERGFTGDEPQTFYANGRAVWQVIEPTAITLELSRQLDFAINSALLVRSRVALGVAHMLPYHLEALARVAYELQEPVDDAGGQELTTWRVASGVGWRPVPWLSLGVELSYENTTRESFGDFDVFRAGVSLTFEP